MLCPKNAIFVRACALHVNKYLLNGSKCKLKEFWVCLV